ncbi:uncharacterized protein LACBIDRAFT_335832 [Laccaria bicolor S238N-H82]|uniref:Predicted protein n=1 Tax=Laccaria bicolor (strain S238N-H82 / ATCC MYA-4686) TaxID=486041 RepID=B0E3K1_LACBS|nr:uncharacterized protein LACBIDRAFT_335832 [Laccaria bicolor S238N-H82]EDQ98582.1 predicted protein [Laccaria bicolor S238N-H82]|eukprot:XP_001890771.1 predicted protein [Laccaria bicolor S238N-H82]
MLHFVLTRSNEGQGDVKSVRSNGTHPPDVNHALPSPRRLFYVCQVNNQVLKLPPLSSSCPLSRCGPFVKPRRHGVFQWNVAMEGEEVGSSTRIPTKSTPFSFAHVLFDSIPQDRQGLALTAFSDLLFPFSYSWPALGCCTRFVIARKKALGGKLRAHGRAEYRPVQNPAGRHALCRPFDCAATSTSVGDRWRIRLAAYPFGLCVELRTAVDKTLCCGVPICMNDYPYQRSRRASGLLKRLLTATIIVILVPFLSTGPFTLATGLFTLLWVWKFPTWNLRRKTYGPSVACRIVYKSRATYKT